MARLLYRFSRLCCRYVCFHTQITTIVHRNRLERPGGYVLACTHLSHLEPVLLSTYMHRTVNWVARIEFYQFRILAWFLNYFDAIPVDRTGNSLPTVRHAIGDAKAGEIVGIFPEGGCARGEFSVCRGGAIKRGACTIAHRASVPIVPVVVIGADRLDKVLPWVPWRRGELLMHVGEPIYPPAGKLTRQMRIAYGEQLRAAFRDNYELLCAQFNLSPAKMAGESDDNSDTFAAPARARS